MPSWGKILNEINTTGQNLQAQNLGNVSPFDLVRRKYLKQLADHTKRPTILYSTAWTAGSAGNLPPELISIGNDDTHGFMETIHGLSGPSLDLIIHSPGGSPTAAEAIVQYLRTKFTDVRVIVPNMAMSAATMIACSSNRIIMGKHSFLGPIDPQMIMQTSVGPRAVPAQAIIAQFEKAQEECADPVKLRAWVPMLNQYGPDLLVSCKNASMLSEQLVGEWLFNFMFERAEDKKETSETIASWLAGHDNFLSHGRPLGRDVLREKGLLVDSLEEDQTLQDLALSVFHAAAHTFAATPTAKIIENHNGKAFLRMFNRGGAAQPHPA